MATLIQAIDTHIGVPGELTGEIVEIIDNDSDKESVNTCDVEVNYFEEDGKYAYSEFLSTEPPENYLYRSVFYTDDEANKIYDDYWNDLTESYRNFGCPEFAVYDLINYDLYMNVQTLWELSKKLEECKDLDSSKKLSKEINDLLIRSDVLRDFRYDDGIDQEWEDEYYGRA